MKVQREKIVQAHVVQLLRTMGAAVYVLGHPAPNDGRRHRGTGQTPGLPDVMAFLPLQGGGFRLLVVECKAAGGRLRREQQLFRHQCVGAGVAHVTGDLDAVIEWLLAEKYLAPTQVPHYRLPKDLQAPPP